MQWTPDRHPSIVVGIEDSRAAIDPALWAVGEALARGIPLRLPYAIEPDDSPQITGPGGPQTCDRGKRRSLREHDR